MAVFTGIVSAIGGAIASVSSFIGGLGAVGTFLLKTAVGVGLNLLAKAIAGKPEKPQFSVQGQLQAGGDVPRSFIFGRTVTAGSLVYANTWGKEGKTPNAYFTQVIALSDIPIAGISQLWVNGEPVTIDTNDTSYGDWGYPVTEYKTDGNNNHMWVKFYDGTQTAADPFLVNTVSNGTRPWQATRVGRGVAYAIITSEVDEELFTGFPQFKFEVQGSKLYDISKDSTAGGNGPQRRSDPSTWGGDGDDLPAVQIFNLLSGITYENSWLYGLQNLPSARLPAADWIAQINKCRAQVQGPNGLEPQYLTGGEIHVGAQIADAIEAILTGCQGRLSESGGVYKVHVGEPDAPVFAFSDGDILSTEEQSFTPFFGLADTINGINATYPEPAEGWNTKTAPALYNTTYEAQDGNRRLMADVQLDMVYRSSQVQRLMKSALAEGRRARRHTFVLPPSAWILEPGDVVSFTSERNGYQSKLMRVDGVVDRGNLDVMVDLTEVDPTDYDWNQQTDYTPPVFGPVGPVRPSPQPIIDWFAEPAVVPDNAGKPRRPAIKLSWDGDQPDVAAVEFEVRLTSSLVVVYTGRTDQPEAGSLLISQGLLPNTQYGVRGRYKPISDRPTLWSDWLPVTTPDVLLGKDDVYFDIDIGDLNNTVQEALGWLGDSLRYVQEELDRIGAMATEQDGGNYFDKKQLRTELSVTAEGLRADYTLQIAAAVGPGSAIVSRIEALEVQVNNDIAQAVDLLSTEISTVNDQVVANANAITALSATVDGISASVTVRGQAQASPGGGWARYGIEVKTGSGNDWSSAAFFLDTNGSTSRAVFLVDQFVISDPSGNIASPFIFQNGIARMQNAWIGDVQFNSLSSSNGKWIARGYGNFADLRIFA